jgi:ACS family hexuronate transporter-like MFS transporter
MIQAGRGVAVKSEWIGIERWLVLAKNRNVWGIVIGKGLTDPIWWFYVLWLPQYLSDARGFSLKGIALFAWIPFVAADVGNFTGAFISGYCIRRGMSVVKARLWVCAASSLPMLAGIPAFREHNAYVALALICVVVWGYASWSTMGLTLPSDLFPQDVVASVTGVSGFVAGLAGAGFTFLVGFLVDKKLSYGPAFIAAGLLPIVATICLFALVREEPPAKQLPQVRGNAAAWS